MRKLIYAINLTLDGCCDHTKVVVPDEKLMEYYTQLVQGTDMFVYGRITYELMVPYWPDIARTHSETKAENDYADAFNAKKIVVFSQSLESSDDKNTTFVHGDLKEEILKLKEEKGGDILTGGVSIPAQLTQLGLIDEFRFVITPTIVGEGRRLFDNLQLKERLRLKLVESKVFDSGCVTLRYLK
ncbi:MAG TPA: dihydrofolate reductase family protein [Candidatus Paceibacterota bacterium]|nr:dihydrofolate reductase family protein [Candidatus Paceibacterota bacterium]